MTDPGAYPKELQRDATLRDGTRVRIRPIRPEDEPRLVALPGRLSEDTRHPGFVSAREAPAPRLGAFLR